MVEEKENLELRVSGQTNPFRLSVRLLQAVRDKQPVSLIGIGHLATSAMLRAMIEANKVLDGQGVDELLWTIPEFVEGDTPETICVFMSIYTHKPPVSSLFLVDDRIEPSKLLGQITKSLEDQPKQTYLMAKSSQAAYAAVKSLIYLNDKMAEVASDERAYLIPSDQKEILLTVQIRQMPEV